MSNIFPNTGRQDIQVITLRINRSDLVEDSEQEVLRYINQQGLKIGKGEIILVEVGSVSKYLITNRGKGEYGDTIEPLTEDNISKVYRESIDDKYYVHEQNIPSEEWTVNHGLNKKPSVSVTDSEKRVVECTIEYIDDNTLIIRLNGAFSGKAYLN